MLKLRPYWLLLFALFFLLIASEGLLAQSYFLYDLNDNKILYMGENETVFTEKIAMDKKPDYIMPTSDPDRYLAVFTPDQKQENAGRLVIFNIKSGRTEDLVELGFYPYRWQHSSDYNYLYISYCTAKNGDTFELLKYDLKELKPLKLGQLIKKPVVMTLTDNNQMLYLIENSEDQTTSRLLTITADTLEIKSTLSVGKYPDRLFVLGNERIAVLNRDRRDRDQIKENDSRAKGSLKLIDTLNNRVIEEKELKETDVYAYWDDEQKVLIVSVDYSRFFGTFGLKGKGEFYKVTEKGIVYHLIKEGWIDLDYLPELDRLYVLCGKSAQVIDYKNNKVSEIKTGNNLIPNGYGDFYICYFKNLKDTNYEIIYCYSNGDMRFIDLTENKMVKKIRSGREGRRFLQTLGGGGKAEAVITTNAEKSTYYILNKATKDITVLNQSFEVVTHIVPKEDPLGMYQVKKAGYQTIVTTEKMIYRIDRDNTLTPLYKFEEKPKFSDFIENEGRIIVWTDREIVVLDAASLEVTDQFCWYVKKDQVEVKLPKDSRRYWFLRTL